jgi:hypothetical protein
MDRRLTDGGGRMTVKNANKSSTKSGPNNALCVPQKEDEREHLATARAVIAPDFRHGVTVAQIMKPQMGTSDFAPGAGDYADAIQERADAAAKGDLAFASRMLAAQAMTLDTIFSEMARRMALNMSEYLGATETYGRIAMRAQAQSRATLEALAKLHQPREQTVKHVHVNEGGQAVVADHFHAGGEENGKTIEQSHATGSAPRSPALPGPDPLGNGMPIPSRERETALQDARRDKSGSA